MIEVKEVIITDINKKGAGTDENSPVRSITEIYTKEGDLLASSDPFGNYSMEQMIEFAELCRQKKEGVSVAELFRRCFGCCPVPFSYCITDVIRKAKKYGF